MGLGKFLKKLLSGEADPPQTFGQSQGIDPAPTATAGLNVDELARRLGMDPAAIQAVQPAYQTFEIAKRSGGTRKIAAPAPPLKALQRTILRRLLGRLKGHDAACGFQRGRGIVSNARAHVGKALVLRMDLKNFFDRTPARKVEAYFRAIGWDKQAAALLTGLVTYKGSLPQGAPTSPRLSNLVNYRLDCRLAALAEHFGAAYTRYADDMTFSLAEDDRRTAHALIRGVKIIVEHEGYELHQGRKLRIYRQCDRQMVTGLVVNSRPNLPRRVRRLLRAARHHHATGRPATLTPQQLAGWQALQDMVARQAAAQ